MHQSCPSHCEQATRCRRAGFPSLLELSHHLLPPSDVSTPVAGCFQSTGRCGWVSGMESRLELDFHHPSSWPTSAQMASHGTAEPASSCEPIPIVNLFLCVPDSPIQGACCLRDSTNVTGEIHTETSPDFHSRVRNLLNCLIRCRRSCFPVYANHSGSTFGPPMDLLSPLKRLPF